MATATVRVVRRPVKKKAAKKIAVKKKAAPRVAKYVYVLNYSHKHGTDTYMFKSNKPGLSLTESVKEKLVRHFDIELESSLSSSMDLTRVDEFQTVIF